MFESVVLGMYDLLIPLVCAKAFDGGLFDLCKFKSLGFSESLSLC